MQVIPVLDVRKGSAVHAVRGVRAEYRPVNSVLVEGADPTRLARALRALVGHDVLYLADLDAIEGDTANHGLVRALEGEGFRVWVDAGVNSVSDALALRRAGAARVILGSESIPGCAFIGRAISALGADGVGLSLDLDRGVPRLSDEGRAGWEGWEGSPLGMARLAYREGMRLFLSLEFQCMGTSSGLADWAEPLLTGLVPECPEAACFFGGGLSDVRELERLSRAGAAGVLAGTVLHAGRFESPGRQTQRNR